ncbi:MAG: HAMP domain-containing histidine kinase, partial [Acidimicrobiia bacterium]|nr:HAMP domain-containing histidine kinase [Acidimicrobiia bacterium]
ETTTKVSRWAAELHRLDEIQRLVEGQRSAVGLATHLSALEERLDGWDLEKELTDTLHAVDDAEAGLASQLGAGTPLPSVATFTEVARSIADAVRSGETESAQEIAAGSLNSAFTDASKEVIGRREIVLADLTGLDRAGARFGDMARLTVILVVPLALVLVYREIVERQLSQRQLEMQLEAEQELAQARDEFVANASHELRTPLTGILGLSEILVEDDRIPPDAREMLGMVTTEASDLARMVEDLLTTARLSAGQLRYEPRRVSTTEEAEVLIRPFVQANQTIAIDVEDAAVHVDRLRQRQVLRNLISNATKYGGPNITLVGESRGVTYRWMVTDDGPGVPPELERKLFQRYIHTLTFQQAVAGGVGLGLSIVKSLAEGMGGSVGYDRSQGLTRFIVDVPLADASSGSRPSIRAAGGVR